MSFQYDLALKMLVQGSPHSTSIWPLGFASAPYLGELGSRKLINTIPSPSVGPLMACVKSFQYDHALKQLVSG